MTKRRKTAPTKKTRKLKAAKVFDPSAFVYSCLDILAEHKVNSSLAISCAMNLMLEVMLRIVESNPVEAVAPIQAVATTIGGGFDKLATAPDAIRMREILSHKQHFGMKPGPK